MYKQTIRDPKFLYRSYCQMVGHSFEYCRKGGKGNELLKEDQRPRTIEILEMIPTGMVIRIPLGLKMEIHKSLLNNNHPHPSNNQEIQTPINNLGNLIPRLKLDPHIHLLILSQHKSGATSLKTQTISRARMEPKETIQTY